MGQIGKISMGSLGSIPPVSPVAGGNIDHLNATYEKHE